MYSLAVSLRRQDERNTDAYRIKVASLSKASMCNLARPEIFVSLGRSRFEAENVLSSMTYAAIRKPRRSSEQ
jgi:hypothetical protein